MGAFKKFVLLINGFIVFFTSPNITFDFFNFFKFLWAENLKSPCFHSLYLSNLLNL